MKQGRLNRQVNVGPTYRKKCRMTEKTIALDERGNQIKTPGWFSWRHKTREAHEQARANYLASHGPEARREAAAARETTPRSAQRLADLALSGKYRGAR